METKCLAFPLRARRREFVGALAMLALTAACTTPMMPPPGRDRPVTSPRPNVLIVPNPGQQPAGPRPAPGGGDAPVSDTMRGQGPIMPSPGGSAPATGAPQPGTRPADAAPGVTGRVTDRRGRAVVGAFVQARGVGAGASPVPDIAVFTNSSGEYRWFLQPGRYELTVTAQGRSSASRTVRVGARGIVVQDFVLD